jgi:hypothetical protein
MCSLGETKRSRVSQYKIVPPYRDHPIVRATCIAKSSLATKCLSVVLKVLHGTFVFLCGFLCSERAQVAPAAGFGIFLARIKAVLTRF